MASDIIRLKRTDKSGQHLLVHVTEVAAKSKSLDIKLIGTEHEHLYHAKIQDSNIKSLQATNYSGNLQEWKDILKYTLLHQKPTGPLPLFLQGVETVAAIKGKTLTITIRKNVEGITQRLGSIQFDQDDEREEVSPFEWVDVAVANSDALRAELGTLQASMSEQQEEVAKLTKQLDELVQAKKEHEEELLKKFAALLNAKKLKIRDQQRLLAGAKVDPKVANAVGEARGSASTARNNGVAKTGKRKADDVEEQDGEGEETSENDDVQQETPPRTDDDETEDEGDLDAPVQSNSRASKGKAAEAVQQANDGEMEIDNEPPPRRELPPTLRNSQPTRVSKPATRAAAAEEDDDETDDEL